MKEPGMTKAASGHSPITTAIVAAAVAAVAGIACAEVPPPELVAIRREVLTALAGETTAKDFHQRRQAVAELLAIHERLEADGRFAASPALQALRRRVAGRLVRVGRTLAGEAAHRESAAARSDADEHTDPAAGGRQAEAQKLIDLIQATVRPETWDVNGGRGSMAYFANGHGLVVLAPDDVHDDLGGLLRQLR
jgi:hypothetical protein